MNKRILFLLAFLTGMVSSSLAQQTYVDYTQGKTLHTIANAHFDTQWRWTVQQSIDEFLKNTLLQNFALFEKYPNYKFNFEGAIKYMWAKEY